MQRQYDELCTVIDYAEGSALKKEFVKRDILKTLKRTGVLDVTELPPSFRWNLCAARLRSGRFDDWDGWEYRSNWAITFQGYNGCQKLKVPKWMGQPAARLTVLGEQGVGDEIAFASALPDLIYRVGHGAIEFQTYPRLKPIIERSLRIRCTDRRVLSEVDGEYCVALGDLLRFYRRDKSHFPRKPYLKPDPEGVTHWQKRLERLGPQQKVGIAWRSRHGNVDPRQLMRPNVCYVNLQYDAQSNPLPTGIVDLGQDPLTDMEGHFALIAALDKVVSVTQTCVHVAGSLGKECHAIIPPRGTGEVNNYLWYHYGSAGSAHYLYGSVKVYDGIADYAAHS